MTRKSSKYLMAAISAVVAVGGCVFLNSCGGNKNSDDTTGEEIPTAVKTDKPAQPDSVVVMVDKSASMKGYFAEGAAGKVSALMEAFKKMGNKNSAKFSDNTPITSNAGQLKNAKNFASDTDFSVLLKAIATEASAAPVVLITDGIVSTAQGKDDQSQIESEIESTLGNEPSLAYAIFRTEVPYNGSYWVESSRTKGYKTVNLKVPNRPIFAVVVGGKDYVQYMADKMAENKDIKTEALVFNTHSDHSGLNFVPSIDQPYEFVDGQKLRVLKDRDYEGGYDFSVTLPACLIDVTKSNIPLAKVSINGKSLALSRKGFKPDVEKDIWGYSLSGETLVLNIPTYVISNETKYGEENTIELKYPINRDDQWKSYFSDDDSDILNSSDEQTKTYGLETLVDAMYDAQNNNDVKISFKYTN